MQIPGQEGRAGMAAVLDPESSVDFVTVSLAVKKNLPTYARPIFIRILRKVDMTGKNHLVCRSIILIDPEFRQYLGLISDLFYLRGWQL